MKKVLIVLLTVMSIAFGCLALSSCTPTNPPSGSNENTQIMAIYDLYVNNAEAKGETPLSYADWLATVKGEDGLSAYEIWLQNGNSGTQGDFLNWLKGEAGEKGDKGDKGDQGEQGIQGEKGDKGDQGEQGIQGEKGDKGDQGEQGIQGEKGDQGDQGEQGIQGDKGDKGDQGEDGKSAYEIWLDMGNQGTEADFLAWLKGEANHSYSEWKLFSGDGLSCSERIFYRVCADCQKMELKHGSDNDHSWSSSYITDDESHWLKCTLCGEEKDRGLHTKGDNNKCNVCNQVLSTEGIIYEESTDGTYAFVKGYEGTSEDVIIENSYNDLPVTKIHDGAFFSNEIIKSIKIPDSVTSIGERAFNNCSSLTSVVIGDSVTSIGSSAFYNCNSLTNVEIPDSVTFIGYEAFQYCSSLTSVKVPDSVTFIGSGAFSSCNNITSIEVGGNNKNYESIDGVLCRKYGTTLIQYPAGKSAALYTVPNSITTIEYSAFRGCNRLTSVIISDNVTTIDGYAFKDCPNLTSITLGKGIKVMGAKGIRPFDNDSLYTVHENVRYLGADGNPYYYFVNAVNENESSYTIHPDTKVIINDAFCGFKELANITIPEGVTYIGDYAFQNCISLTSVEIPNSVTSIGFRSFDDCINLTEVIIGGDTSIGEDAFNNCKSLTKIVIGGIISIGNGAFSNCDSLSSIEISDLANWCQIDGLSRIVFSSRTLYINGEELSGEIVIPSTVTEIKPYAFSYCDKITSIVVDESVTAIGNAAFYQCGSLTNVVIGNSVTSIGSQAFDWCEGLTIVVIGDSVTSIDYSAFYQCNSLTSVYYNGSAEEWNKISIGHDNEKLINAARYYYIENEADVPTDGGNYWHYDENGEIAVW